MVLLPVQFDKCFSFENDCLDERPIVLAMQLWLLAVTTNMRFRRRKDKLIGTDITVHGNQLTATENHMPYGITQCYLPPGSSDFPAFTKPKLVLDLATPEVCKAELT